MSHEPVSPSEWAAFRAAHTPGDALAATVVSVVPFGAFLEVAPGIHGLLHTQEWRGEPQVGATLNVRIRQLDDENRRLSLTPA
ncbi:S1 RNA-binding domain-containing protein [Nocardia sp. CA2R105]|uniref:S1 RNA-binding domain-containing protein n=1 Tax=Nocardia coffeae TaxID=2873381 RepID=UPI001CA6D112|nr:S1 RNA-binding domain-containing protein [Nocardia coffeae]MBY8859652.1 S1 RNA-binding domain-containing protein [Nocardia coffeae]